MNNRRLVGAGPFGGPISHSGRRLLTTGFALLLPLAVLSGTGQARADALPSNCTQSTTVVTCTYLPGAEGVFTPPGLSRFWAVVVGGAGGSTLGGTGGPGAQVVGSFFLRAKTTVTYYIEVDIGGGSGGADGAGGGGESDIRVCPIADSTCAALGTMRDPRLWVAGGGGGAGAAGGGGNGGSAGTGSGTSLCYAGNDGTSGFVGEVGGGGGGGGCSAGGAGGPGGPGGIAGTAGTATSGGAGGNAFHGGGGGGAGCFGGGGGGSNGTGAGNGGGGGGGSSCGPYWATYSAATTGPEVEISYPVLVPAAPAGTTPLPGLTRA